MKRKVFTVLVAVMATIGLRKGYKVYGIGAGHSMFTTDAEPSTFYSIPFYAYNRIYAPMGRSDRFYFYTDQFLGYETIYKVRSGVNPIFSLEFS